MKTKIVVSILNFLTFTFVIFVHLAHCEVKNIIYGEGLGFANFEIASTEEIQNVAEKIKFNSTDTNIIDLFPEANKTKYILKKIARTKSFSEHKRIAAIQLLGKLRITFDVDILADNILLGYTKKNDSDKLNENNFPVGFALIEIGVPARKKLLQKVKTAKNDELIPLCAYVISKIEGTDVAKFIFTKAMEQEQHSKTKAKLQKALDFLE